MYCMSFIYAGLDSCRSLSFKDGSTWVKCTITANKTIADALTEWVTLANASGDLSLTYSASINTTTGAVTISAGGAFYLKFHGSLEKLLGFEPNASTKTLAVGSDGTATSTTTPMGLCVVPGGFEAPKPMESARLESLRHGRSHAFIHNHGRHVRAWFYMDRATFDAYDAGPMFSGLFRFYHTATATEYSPTNLDGYLDLYPFGRPVLLTRGTQEQFVRVEIDCMLDEGYTIPLPSSPSYAAIGAALPFGWSTVYALRIEGITSTFLETSLTGVAPTNTTARTGLVIDHSAKVGSVADRTRGIGKSFKLTVGILDDDTSHGSAIRAHFAKPSAFCSLTADLAYNQTGTINVDDTTGFESSGVLYIGNEAINYTGKTGTTFTGLTRAYAGNRAYNHSERSEIGVFLADKPFSFRGREVWLHAIPIDPFGEIPNDTIAASANLLDEAPVMFRGHIASHPVRAEEKWSFTCQPMVRRLTDPLIAGVSGQASWSLDDDIPTKVDVNAWLTIFYLSNVGASEYIKNWSLQPFAALNASTWYTMKQLRTYLAAQLTSLFSVVSNYPNAAAPRLSAFGWKDFHLYDEKTGLVIKKSRLTCTVTSQSDDTTTLYVAPLTEYTGNGAIIPWLDGGTGYDQGDMTSSGDGALHSQVSEMPNNTETAHFLLPCYATANVNSGILEVKIDEGLTDEIPDSGYVLCEGEAGAGLYTYTSAVDNSDGTVSVKLDPNVNLDIPKISQALAKGEGAEVSVKFAYPDEGTYHDMMLRMIMSSGKAGVNHATYDAKGLEQGYDLAHVNVDSFTSTLDGPIWKHLAGKCVYESGEGFGVFSGLLGLSQRCVVENERSGDTKIELVHTSFGDSGTYAQTITNAHLVTSRAGSDPVRPLQVIDSPNLIEATSTTSEDTRKGHVIARDVQKMRTMGTSEMVVKIKGMTRSQLAAVFYDFAYSWFAVGNGRPQACELDVHPSIDVKVGDPIKLTLMTHNLWQYGATPEHRGYDGFARVIGRQINLATGIQTLTLLLDGVLKSMALSPAAKVSAFGGSAGSPSTITVPEIYHEVFTRWLDGESTVKVIAYAPMADSTSYGYNISAATKAGGNCVLTVDSVIGTFNIAAGWYITNALTADSNTAQSAYAHTDSEGVWI